MEHTNAKLGVQRAHPPAWQEGEWASSAISSHPVTLSNLHPLESQHDIVTNLLPEAPEERRQPRKALIERWSPSLRCAKRRPPITEGSSHPGSRVGATFPLVPSAPRRSVDLFQELSQRHALKFGYKERNASFPGQAQFLHVPGPLSHLRHHEVPST